jgi:hypothetical protein
MKLHFINYCHNGDIHYSKRFMMDLYNIINPTECFLHHVKSPRLISDMPYIKSEPPVLIENLKFKSNPPLNSEGVSPSEFIRKAGICPEDNIFCDNAIHDEDIYIVTWLAYYWFGDTPVSSEKDCSIYSNYEAYKVVYDQLGIIDQLKPIEYYVPAINFDYVEKTNIDNFCIEHPHHKILVCNGEVLSGQCTNFSFTPILFDLAAEFPDIIFITTKKISLSIPNVYCTDDIINITGCDLNEIGYLSTKCCIIVGRGSGPFGFAHISENFNDKKKTMIGFSNNSYNAFWYFPEQGCKQIWSDNYEEKHVYNTIKNEVSLL